MESKTDKERMEDLLRPRYKVIADYPHSPYKVGELLEITDLATSFHCTTTKVYDSFTDDFVNSENYFSIDKLEQYSHLFRKLSWWEERDVSEMPEYVKWVEVSLTTGSNMKELGNTIEKVEEVINRSGWLLLKVGSQINHIDPSYFIPATLEDYTTYLNKTLK